MEFLIVAIALSIVAIYGMWRVRRVGSSDEPDRPIEPPPDDQRYKTAFPDDPVTGAIPLQRPVSRESGHGKDGS